MGLIKGFFVVILSFLLLASFLAMNISLILTFSLQYDNVKEVVGPEIRKAVNEEMNVDSEVIERLPELQIYCETNTDFTFSEQGYTFIIPCDLASEGVEIIIDESIDSVIESVYYKEYNCKFWNCLKEEGIPFFLVSEKAKNYWKGNFILTLLVSVGLMLLLLLLVSRKYNALVVPGFLLILASLPFMKFGVFSTFSTNSLFLSFIKIFFSKSQDAFIISLTVGIVLIVLGILIKLFMIGFRISEWFGKSEETKQVTTKQVVTQPVKQKTFVKKNKESLFKKFLPKFKSRKK